MFLWNLIIPQVTHLSTITYWQALALVALCRMLFGRFSFGWGWPFNREHDHILKDKLAAMNADEKAAFKEEWRKRCEER